MRREPFDVLVLDAQLRQSLVAVRSLGRRGLGVAALEIESLAERVPTFASRWCRSALIAPSFERDPLSFVEHLALLIEASPGAVVIASSDGAVAAIQKFRRRLAHARIALAGENALALATNKARTLAIAAELQMGVPRGVHVERAADTAAAISEVGLPAVVKPVESWQWGQDQTSARLFCRLVTTREEARQAVEALTAIGGTVLVQQFLSGAREAISLFYAGGEIHARFAQWAKRMQPPLGGTSVFRCSIALPRDLDEQAERLVRAIDLEGYSEIEFRRDAAGRPYLMEINPRLSASVEVAVRAGVDFPQLLFQWARGERIARVRGYRVGNWMRYLQGDFVTTVQSVAQRGRPGVTPPARALFDFAAAFFVPSGYDYFAWNDPGPSVRATANFGRVVLRHLRRLLT